MSSRHSSPPSRGARRETRLTIYRRGGPAERAGQPEGWRRCVGEDGGVTAGHLKVTWRQRLARCGGVPCAGGETASGSGAAAAAAGRPRFGGCATSTSGGDVQGFNLRVDTVSTLSPICSLKKRRERSNTRKGPS